MTKHKTEPNSEPQSMNEASQPTLAEQLQAALADRDKYKENWARAMADLDNFRKRIYREMDERTKVPVRPDAEIAVTRF